MSESVNLFVNRELSLLEFNQRIMEEASDPEVPLLERLKFIAIVSSNLDEFFMIRVAGLKQQLKSGVMETGPEGLVAQEQLKKILPRVARQVADQERVLVDELLPALAREGIEVLRMADLGPADRAGLEDHFRRSIFPMLTPLAIDPGHPFPFMKNRTLNLAVQLLPVRSGEGAIPLLAVVEVPTILKRFVDLPERTVARVVFIEDLITEFVGQLFPGLRIVDCVPFRVVRNWDLEVDEDEQEDLLEAVQSELQRRWRLDAVRLEVGKKASEDLITELRQPLKLDSADVHVHQGPLALGDFDQLLSVVGRTDLRDPPFQPVDSPRIKESDNLFAEIARGDILLHHPYESYTPVVDLVRLAAADPNVLAIKQTLYRTNRDSPLVRSLAEAAQNGKQVTALVELKARFDEQQNIEWARELEEAGVQVFYGMIGLKTHCKVAMVVRREASGIRRYVHLGTGNYNEKTARTYCDLSFFTARDDFGEDVASLFNLLTGYSDPPQWKKLVVAPLDLRSTLIQHIAKVRAEGKAGEIIIKSNALIDANVIRELCKASQNGASVKLLIRGPCALRVGIPDVSDRIVARTLVDRFLEHSRIFYFKRGNKEDVFLTSTDIMPRNFDRRLEVMWPIEDDTLKRRIIDEVLAVELSDTTKAADLQADGTWKRLAPGAERRRAQATFITQARKRSETHTKADKKDIKRRKKKKRRDA